MKLLIHGNKALANFPYEILEDFIWEYFPGVKEIIHSGTFDIVSKYTSERNLKSTVFKDDKFRNIQMLKESDYALLIWNGSGQKISSLATNARLLGKPYKVYSTYHGTFTEI